MVFPPLPMKIILSLNNNFDLDSPNIGTMDKTSAFFKPEGVVIPIRNPLTISDRFNASHFHLLL